MTSTGRRLAGLASLIAATLAPFGARAGFASTALSDRFGFDVDAQARFEAIVASLLALLIRRRGRPS
jgi:hypothetical protein